MPWVASAGPGWILESSFESLIRGPKSYWDVGSSKQEAIEIQVWNQGLKQDVIELLREGMETLGAWNL